MKPYIAYSIMALGFTLAAAGMAFGASIDNAVLMCVYALPGVAVIFAPALICGVQA